MLAGLSVLVVVAGLRAVGPAAATHGPLRQHGLLVGLALEFVLASLLIAVVIAGRRPAARTHPALVLRVMLGRITALAMIVVGVVIVAEAVHFRKPRKTSKPPSSPHGIASPKPLPVSGRPHGLSGAFVSYLLYAALALVLLAVIVACVVVIRRRALVDQAAYLVDAEDDSQSLERAVASGRAALWVIDDARAAIIACYAAMESSLERAGTARDVAGTPDELLAKAATAGLVRGAAASRLTALFYEARFSTHALPGAARDEARAALDAISADLHGRAVASQQDDSVTSGEPR